ncbi:hypothetical protein ACFFUB_06280 [Algimonas porphyrae]|uniref:Nucleotidyltransferase n=1 Tax=Algimonas porphyrae TaxID=1128113 RepID=A0ABQ5V2Q5_9PROT|nr:hypothetical protein [Algimonas porphyrae]GLQ21234.1 hypothetical protein GCM10007854_21890 [Algimonas porphyrae]
MSTDDDTLSHLPAYADHPISEQMKALVSNIVKLLNKNGPTVGATLSEWFPDVPPIELWRACYVSHKIRIRNCARYYLRYDIKRDNALRLSPSILRDFLTFSLIYLPEQAIPAVEAGTLLANKFRSISLRKLSRARQALLELAPDLQAELNAHCVVFLSGDIAYFLAHDTLRRHATLEVPVNGSDIDIVIVANNQADPAKIAAIEAQMLKIKRLYLLMPQVREELDFIVKPVERMLEQLSYRDIHEKIASKILYESYFLMGRVDIYEALMKGLEVSGTRDKIEADFETALIERQQTIRKILSLPATDSVKDSEVASLFFASQERLEFQ